MPPLSPGLAHEAMAAEARGGGSSLGTTVKGMSGWRWWGYKDWAVVGIITATLFIVAWGWLLLWEAMT